MTDELYHQLNEGMESNLTQDEINEGWHFCLEFDGLLIGPGCGELEGCSCLPPEHPVYKTKKTMAEKIAAFFKGSTMDKDGNVTFRDDVL